MRTQLPGADMVASGAADAPPSSIWSIASARRVIRPMSETIADLHKLMDAASEAMDFERAGRLRDRINLIRGGATCSEAEQADTSGLIRQQPGAMGIGTSQQRITPPAGWKAPSKPDPMTSGESRRGKRRR